MSVTWEITRLTQPATEPVSLDEAKAQLRIGFADDDAEIGRMIAAARQRAEDYCNRPFASASWSARALDIPTGNSPLRLPFSGVTGVSAMSYRDENGTVQTFSTYTLDAARQEVTPDDVWPRGSDLRLEIVAGDDSSPAPVVPAPVTAAILMFIAGLYEQRSALALGKTYDENPAPYQLLQPYRERMGI